MTSTPDEPFEEPTPAQDPAQGQAPADEPQTPDEPADEQDADRLATALAERTADLQRLQAEYVNYKRRVDRDRELVKASGEARVLESLLTVLDDLGRAEEHGELTGGFKAVADELRAVVARHGLESFGETGEIFDPALHEAVFAAGESSEVSATSVGPVLRIGYKVGERVLRPATVGVVEPADENAEPEAGAEAPAEPGSVQE